MSIGGRPVKYDPAKNELVTKFCRLGCTDEELADFLDIATSTLYEWKNTYPKFSEAIQKGKEESDMDVTESLYKSALGRTMEYEEQAVTNKGEVVTLKKTAVIPPNVTAQIFWSKNRRPKHWRDRQELEHSGQVTGITVKVIQPDNGSDKE